MLVPATQLMLSMFSVHVFMCAKLKIVNDNINLYSLCTSMFPPDCSWGARRERRRWQSRCTEDTERKNAAACVCLFQCPARPVRDIPPVHLSQEWDQKDHAEYLWWHSTPECSDSHGRHHKGWEYSLNLVNCIYKLNNFPKIKGMQFSICWLNPMVLWGC